jgi:hypothetical protein
MKTRRHFRWDAEQFRTLSKVMAIQDKAERMKILGHMIDDYVYESKKNNQNFKPDVFRDACNPHIPREKTDLKNYPISYTGNLTNQIIAKRLRETDERV